MSTIAGTPDPATGCEAFSDNGNLRADQFDHPGASFVLRNIVANVPTGEANSCTANVTTQAGQILQSLDMSELPNTQPVGTSSIYGEAAINASVKAELIAARAIQVRSDCTYGPSGTRQVFAVSVPLTVLPAPAGEFAGVSVNTGALASKSTAVQLTMSWSGLASKVAISNDGGFLPGTFTMKALKGSTTAWNLVSDGSDRIPKTVYVRFYVVPSNSDIGSWTTPYSDDIILDTTRPLTAGDITTASPTTVALTLKSADNRTGVKKMQVNVGVASTKAPVVAYAATTSWPRTTRNVFVRVQDGAGNWSLWRQVINPSATKVSAFPSGSTLRKGATLTVTGRLTRWLGGAPVAGRNVLVQRYVNGLWKTISPRTTDADGAYRYSWKVYGDLKFRVAYPGGTSLLPGYSSVRVISVT